MRTRFFTGAVSIPFGLVITRRNSVRPEVVDARGRITDAIEACYRYTEHPWIMDVPLTQCRMLGPVAAPCTSGSSNPFVEALLEYGRDRSAAYEQTALWRFYRSWQPRSVREVLCLDSASSVDRLSASPYLYVFPWEPGDAQTRGERRRRVISNENVRARERTNDRPEIDADAGHPHWGPATSEKGRLEYGRLTRLYDSILENGFRWQRERSGPIGVSRVLVHEDKWVAIVRKGHHRTAVLAALGWDAAPMRFGDRRPVLVHRGDVLSWPQVRSGVFSTAEALHVFDRVFEGRMPDGVTE